MNFMELAAERFSVRQFEQRPLEEETLKKILEAGRLAPTAKNLQPQKIYVLKSPEALEKISSVCRCIFGAPQVLLVCCDKNLVWKNPLQEGYDSGQVDCSIVATHMMLEAWELGVGTCWVGYFNADQVAEAFGLPENIRPVALMPIGYPAPDAKPIEKLHKGYRDLEDMVTVL